MKLFEVSYIGSWRTDVITENLITDYNDNEFVCNIEEITQCQGCGENTSNLELVNGLARCNDCAESSMRTQERAYKLMNEPYNPYDNNYED